MKSWLWIAIDPGDAHTGWAMTETGQTTAFAWTQHHNKGDLGEVTEQLEGLIKRAQRGGIEVTVIVEEFRLYASKAKDQVDSPMLTSQLIGSIKEVCRRCSVTLVEQGASVKKPTKAQIRGRGVKLPAGTVHAKDAVLHLYHYLMKRGWDGKSPLEPKEAQ